MQTVTATYNFAPFHLFPAASCLSFSVFPVSSVKLTGGREGWKGWGGARSYNGKKHSMSHLILPGSFFPWKWWKCWALQMHKNWLTLMCLGCAWSYHGHCKWRDITWTGRALCIDVSKISTSLLVDVRLDYMVLIPPFSRCRIWTGIGERYIQTISLTCLAAPLGRF